MSKKKRLSRITPQYSTRILKEGDRKRVARGKDLYGYGEQKQKINLSITPTAIANLTEVAEQAGLSRSETIERLFRKPLESLVSLLEQS